MKSRTAVLVSLPSSRILHNGYLVHSSNLLSDPGCTMRGFAGTRFCRAGLKIMDGPESGMKRGEGWKSIC